MYSGFGRSLDDQHDVTSVKVIANRAAQHDGPCLHQLVHDRCVFGETWLLRAADG